LSEFIKTHDNGYTLQTSETNEVLMCPDNDVQCQMKGDGTVELTILKKAKVTKV